MCCAGGKVKLPEIRSRDIILRVEMVTSSKFQKHIVHMKHYNEKRTSMLMGCTHLFELICQNWYQNNEWQYDAIINAVTNKSCRLYLLDAPRGTGKTFLISIILATIRSQNKIALAITSSGIAATLLGGGRTVHSALKLSLNMQVIETPTWNITKNSGMGELLTSCRMIVCDECTMAHKKSLKALDRTLKDLRGNEQLFGGALK